MPLSSIVYFIIGVILVIIGLLVFKNSENVRITHLPTI